MSGRKKKKSGMRLAGKLRVKPRMGMEDMSELPRLMYLSSLKTKQIRQPFHVLTKVGTALSACAGRDRNF